jgi:hypothetical protein
MSSRHQGQPPAYTPIYRCDASLLMPGIVLCIPFAPQDLLGKRVKEVVTWRVEDFPWEDYSYRDRR